MNSLVRVLSAPARWDWRNPGTLIRIGILLAVLAASASAFLLRDQLTPAQAGYGGVALASLIASAGLIIPVPALGAVCAGAIFLNPALLGLIAGTSESVGELTGYFLGYSGRDMARRCRIYDRLGSLVRRRSWLPLFLVSLVPNPIFDIVGIAAGLFIAAIHDMGLATLTHTPSPMAFLRRLLGRPENERPFVMFPIGHPLPGLQVPDLRRKSLSEVFVEVDRRGDGSTVR